MNSTTFLGFKEFVTKANGSKIQTVLKSLSRQIFGLKPSFKTGVIHLK